MSTKLILSLHKQKPTSAILHATAMLRPLQSIGTTASESLLQVCILQSKAKPVLGSMGAVVAGRGGLQVLSWHLH